MFKKIIIFSISLVFISSLLFYYGYFKKSSTNIISMKIQDDFNNVGITNIEYSEAILDNSFNESKVEIDTEKKESNYMNSSVNTSLATENKSKDKIVKKEEISNINIISSNNNKESNIVEKDVPKTDKYTFVKNDSEIQRMIQIAKSIIIKNENNKCDGLVNQVDNIEFVICKSGNVFYPFFSSRIENIVIDNFFPQFYVYAEDVYLNDIYQRTEYYFQ